MAYGTVNRDASVTSWGDTSAGLYGFKNRIINGDMKIDQRNAGASYTVPSGNSYSLDRWATYASQASKFTVQQNAGSITPPTGFTNYLGCTSSSAYSVGASDLFVIYQRIEGYNIADLAWGTANAKTITLSFQVYSSLTGTFGGSLQNGNGNRSYPFTYSIPVANTWTPISITIAGDTTGTWFTNNSSGIQLTLSIGAGSTYNGTAGAWAANATYSVSGATSVVGTNGATFYITGVQLEKGTTATSFDYRPYGTELALCQRYCQIIGNGLQGIAATSSNWTINTQFSTPFRASPTASLLSTTIKISDQYSLDATSSSSTIGTQDLTSVGGRFPITGFNFALTQGRYYTAWGNANPFVLLSAEL